MSFRPDDHTWVVCAWGKSRYLEECLRSLADQTVGSRILISTSTPSEYIDCLAEKYGAEVYSHEGGRGIGADWNAGYDRADSALVTIAHQDDIYEPGYTGQMLREMNRSRDPLIFFTDYWELKDGKRELNTHNLKIKRIMLFPLRGRLFRNSRFVRRRILSLGSPICCPSVTYVKAACGDRIFSETMRVSLDWDQWERLSRKKGAFVYSQDPLMCHRLHGESETTRMIADSIRGKEDLEMFRRFWPEGIAAWLEKRYSASAKGNQE